MVYVHDVTVPQLRTKWLGKICSFLLITDDSKQTIKNLCSQVMLQEVGEQYHELCELKDDSRLSVL